MVRPKQPRIIFFTGTDTGVGKTVLTGLLLSHLRQNGRHALAIKPFCSGGRSDAQLLHALQDGELSLEEINPFYFSEPLAPLVAVRKHHVRIPISAVLTHVRSLVRRFKVQGFSSPCSLGSRPSTLLIEGIGGLLVPLGEAPQSPNPHPAFKVQSSGYSVPYTVLDLISRLRCEVIVVSPNRLGTINHTLLTIRALQAARIKAVKVVLVVAAPSPRRVSDSSFLDAPRSNPGILAELLAPVPLFTLPFLGAGLSRPQALKKTAKRLSPTLIRILAG